jgi:hypothetical protein
LRGPSMHSTNTLLRDCIDGPHNVGLVESGERVGDQSEVEGGG